MRRAILQVLPSLGIGGVEQVCLDILPAVSDAGFLPLVVSGGGAWVSRAEAGGAKHVPLPIGKKNPLTAYGMVRQLCRVMEAHNVCLVHGHSRMPAWVGYYAARRLGVPFVTSFHAAYNFKGALKRHYNSVMVRGDRVIAVSEFIRSHIAAHYADYVEADRVSVIHNGVDGGVDGSRFDRRLLSADSLSRLRRQLDLPDGLRWLVMVGRPTRLKGHDLVVRAYRRLCERYANLALLFIVPRGFEGSWGDGVYVRSVDDDLLPMAYGLGDISVVGSLVPEAFGRVVIEAQMMGSVVVVPSAGGCLELVADGKSGFFYGMGDGDDLARVLGGVLDLSAGERRRVMDAAVGSARNFGLGNYRKKTLAIYEEILK